MQGNIRTAAPAAVTLEIILRDSLGVILRVSTCALPRTVPKLVAIQAMAFSRTSVTPRALTTTLMTSSMRLRA